MGMAANHCPYAGRDWIEVRGKPPLRAIDADFVRMPDAAMTAAVAALFADPAWGTNWSTASNQNLTQRISPSEKVETSVNANEPALRKLAMAYSMVAGLAAEMLPAQTLDVVTSKSRELLGSAIVDPASACTRFE